MGETQTCDEAYMNGVHAGQRSLTSCTQVMTPVGWKDPYRINPYSPYSQAVSHESWDRGFSDGVKSAKSE